MDIIKIEDEPDVGPTEYVFETVDFPTPTKNISLWSNAETKQLIDLYKSFISEVGPLKRFTRKKDMWTGISLQIPNKSSKQCEERFKTLLRRKRKGIADKVSIQEAKRKMFDLEDSDVGDELQIIRKHKIECETDNSPSPIKQVQVWSFEDTKLLMELYKRYICEVGPNKRFIHKKDMWTEISTNFLNMDGVQCLQRYNTVMKRKTICFPKVYITNGRTKMFAFKSKDKAGNHKFKRVYAVRDNKITNDAMKAGSTKHEREETDTQKQTANITESKELRTISETLLKIAAQQEEAKERRHREKMEAIEKMQNILQQILNSKTSFY